MPEPGYFFISKIALPGPRCLALQMPQNCAGELYKGHQKTQILTRALFLLCYSETLQGSTGGEGTTGGGGSMGGGGTKP